MKIHRIHTLLFIILIVLTASLILPVGTVKAKNPDAADKLPDFHAHIEYSHQGYVVKGTFSDFPADIRDIRPLYSTDGKTWESSDNNWDLHWLGDEEALEKLRNQICLYSNNEPLKSYLEEKTDRFFLKLRLTMENGIESETKTATIERGAPQPLPEDLNPIAAFAPSLSVLQRNPFLCYGKYQITVRADSTAEEIAALLPDTLPVEIQLQKEIDHVTEGTIDCPVRWKPLTLPRLTAGESVTIMDAAEEIVTPADTMLHTPLGIFELKESLRIHQYGLTDEIRLVLNVIAEDEKPTGILTEENTGLELAFNLKASGATAIHAYTWTEGDSEWTEIHGCPLLEAVNAQPSTENSGYTPILRKDREPYRSYLAAKAAGHTPTPFLIALKIEGGVYDGRELILSWPDTYELPLQLPSLSGSGGNEGNAGSDNAGSSTPGGQRPSLPLNPVHTENPPHTEPPLHTAPPPDEANHSGTDWSDQSTQPPRMAEDIIISDAKEKEQETEKTDAPDKNTNKEEKTKAAAGEEVTTKRNSPAKTKEQIRQKPQSKGKTSVDPQINVPVSDKKEEKPHRKTGTMEHKTFPLIPVALTAVLTVGTGIFIARIRFKKHTGAN